mmetsp:Transcript_6138/g.15996  ORF Transcript_6138/g.15996 Transcript_6138/m.15996 type:complete len:125 (+) Transcript_6138:60-434(+)|eukprot:CAMPEP_0197422066 /NCGR_PEP_ID=MMETSP1170-20131217/13249_1 /TAXON_ID=54406 /ORGANISM="Sarcinochrysis sp, Strain CCMP770" /LENGTH=124 /DNA_ID=CAMNT_0042949375 /DNA_START=60 /DNA_END=434 /DNA_ORIENTATION=+
MAWRARISHRLHELKILMAGETTDAVNAGVREFLLKNYSDLKILNPKFSFLVRNFKGEEPMFVGVYGWGREEIKPLAGLSDVEVLDALRDLVKLGETYPKSWPITDELPPTVIDATASLDEQFT